MKLESVKYNTQTESNFEESEEVDMLISPEAMPHISKILTNLYSNPEQSVFREYLANALDAHTMAGTSAPVEVYMPNYTTPMFTVTDHGIGMSREEMTKVFSQYGRSNKTDSNDSIGGFGLGSKSALAIAPQFTVISTQDGWSTSAIIANTDLGTPRMTIVNYEKTDGSSGTTVAIPVTDFESFNRESMHLMSYISPDKAKVYSDQDITHYSQVETAYGEKPRITKSETTGATLYSFNVGSKINSSHRLGNFIIMIGDIPYSVKESDLRSREIGVPLLDEYSYRRGEFILEVPIGEISPSPSRESVHFTVKAVEYLKTTMEEIFQTLLSEHLEGITDAEDYFEVLDLIRKLPLSFREYIRTNTVEEVLWNDVEVLKIDDIVVAPQILNEGWEYKNSYLQAEKKYGIQSPEDPRVFRKSSTPANLHAHQLNDDDTNTYYYVKSLGIVSRVALDNYMKTVILCPESVDFSRKISKFANSFPESKTHEIFCVKSLDDIYLATSDGLVRPPSKFIEALIDIGLNVIEIDEFNSLVKDQSAIEKKYREKVAKENPNAIKNPLSKTEYKMMFTNGKFSSTYGVTINTFSMVSGYLEEVEDYYYITKSSEFMSDIFDFNMSTNPPGHSQVNGIKCILGNNAVIFVLNNRSESAFLDRCNQIEVKPTKITSSLIEKNIRESMNTPGLDSVLMSPSGSVPQLIKNLGGGVDSGAYDLEDINDEALRDEVEDYLSGEKSGVSQSEKLRDVKSGLNYLKHRVPSKLNEEIIARLTVDNEVEHKNSRYEFLDVYYYYGTYMSSNKQKQYYLAAVNGIYDHHVLTDI